jgi:hypothetical protein
MALEMRLRKSSPLDSVTDTFCAYFSFERNFRGSVEEFRGIFDEF